MARTHHRPHVPAPASCLRSSASAGRAAEVASQEEVVAGWKWAGVPSVCLQDLPGFLLPHRPTPGSRSLSVPLLKHSHSWEMELNNEKKTQGSCRNAA